MDYNRDYFKGKTAVVTGGTSGIGLALVEELLESNAAKVVMAARSTDKLKEHEKRLQEQYGSRVKGIQCDVSVEKDVQNLIAESAAFFGGQFDLLINNAGAGFTLGFQDATNEHWKAAFDLNFYGAVYGMRAVLPIMIKQGSGQIINIISGIAFIPMPAQTLYSATKAALNALTLAMRAEYWDENIKISSATPGTVATAIWGGGEIPDIAQTPQQSASRILNGAVNNERNIFGDDTDVKYGHNPHEAILEEALVLTARERRKGNWNFLPPL